MSTLARLDDEWHDEVPVARVQGEVDASNVKEIGDRLRSLLSNRSVAMIVDLSATTYLDSAGIRMLFELAQRLEGRRQSLAVVVPPDSLIRHSLLVTELEQAVPMHDSLDAAVDALRTG